MHAQHREPLTSETRIAIRGWDGGQKREITLRGDNDRVPCGDSVPAMGFWKLHTETIDGMAIQPCWRQPSCQNKPTVPVHKLKEHFPSATASGKVADTSNCRGKGIWADCSDTRGKTWRPGQYANRPRLKKSQDSGMHAGNSNCQLEEARTPVSPERNRHAYASRTRQHIVRCRARCILSSLDFVVYPSPKSRSDFVWLYSVEIGYSVRDA